MKGKIMLLIVAVWIAQGCGKRDTQVPAIDRVEVDGVATGHFHGLAGSQHEVVVVVSDNEALDQVKVTLHPHSEGENHPDASNLVQYPIVGTWHASETAVIGGTGAEQHFVIHPPVSISGAWHLEVAVIDEEGNETAQDYDLHVHNDSLPAILVNASMPVANESGTIVVPTGNNFSLDGTVLDTNGLYSVTFYVHHEGADFWSASFTMDGAWSLDLSSISFPSLIESGHYHMEIAATDMHGWSHSGEMHLLAE